MDIDRILENWGEQHNASEEMPAGIKEKCWNNIKTQAKRSWYERAFTKLTHFNSTYHMKLAAAITFAIVLVLYSPILFKNTTNFVQNSAIFNRIKNKPNNAIIDDRPEYKADANYLKALDKVKGLARGKYNKFSIYSNGEVETYNSKPVYTFIIYEELGDSKQNPGKTIVNIEADSLKISDENQIGDYDESFYSNKEDFSPSKDAKELNKWRIAVLINAADKLNYKTIAEALKNIKYDKLPWDKRGNKEIVKGSSFYCESRPNIYYNYDESSGKLYKYDMNTKEKKVIYDYNTDKFNILNVERKEDLDGDGKADEIRFNILNGVLSINGQCINTIAGEGLLDFDVVDLDKKDGHKEIYLKYSGYDVMNTNVFFNYDNGAINSVGYIQYGDPVIDGSGKVAFKNVVSQFFETSVVDKDYNYYKDNVLRIQKKELYKLGDITSDNNEADSYQILKQKKQLNIYKEKGSKEISAVLKVGERVKLIGSDLENWVLVENSKGVRGWFQVEDSTMVKELKLPSYDVFDGLNFAG